MKINYTLTILCLFSFTLLKAGDNCEDNLRQVRELLNTRSPFNDIASMRDLIAPCAERGIAEAEHYMGMLYLRGIGVEPGDDRAFAYIQSAAKKGFDKAQYNLGRLYKQGIGCRLDLEQAIYWYEKAAANGNQRALYMLGYMHFKGYGVKQDYEQAIRWFEQSSYPMAQHHLGLCYYLGYGVAPNEDRALEILLENNIPNSQQLVAHIKANRKTQVEISVDDRLYQDAGDSSYVEPGAIKSTTTLSVESLQAVDTTVLAGNWKGRLVQYDWSGQHVERITPIDLTFTTDSARQVMKVVLPGQSGEVPIQFTGGVLTTKSPFVFTQEKLYTTRAYEPTLDYRVLSMLCKQYTLEGSTYMVARLETFVDSWKEYGEPMSIVIKLSEGATGEDSGVENELMVALSGQQEQVIRLYPVPFHNTLTVQYDLATGGSVHLELFSIMDQSRIPLASYSHQEPGTYTVQVQQNLAGLREGVYVVRMLAGDQLFTRTVYKEN